jgi:hypothetical protein
MCLSAQVPPAPAGPVPVSVSDAVAMAQAGLAGLAGADAATLTSVEQAVCLRGLERAESMRTAARASMLSAFSAGGGYEDDGHGSAKTWLRWQTQITTGAAARAMGWARRLAAHVAVRDALAACGISVSFARCVCDWSDLLPPAPRRLPPPPHHPPSQRRPRQPDQHHPAVHFPLSDSRAPLGLEHRLAPRRDHHRHQP